MASTPLPVHGLSREVALAVLPRLYVEELVAELTRRNISFGEYSVKQESLVVVLKDVMTQEYNNLEAEQHSPGAVAERNFEFPSDVKLEERDQFQCQVLQDCSQKASGICRSDIGNRLSTEAMTQCHDENDAATNQESYSKDDGISSEVFPDANVSWNSNVITVRAIGDADCTAIESELTDTATSSITQPTSQLDNFSLQTEVEQDKIRNDELQCDFQRRNIVSDLSKSSSSWKPSDMTFFSCKKCSYRTKLKSAFVRHTRIHTGEKPFMCTYCDHRASRREHLNTHMLRHLGEKPYKCSECGFKTARKGYLVQHMRRHTGEKPYMCGECGFRTAHKKSMDHHMMKHTGDKPH